MCLICRTESVLYARDFLWLAIDLETNLRIGWAHIGRIWPFGPHIGRADPKDLTRLIAGIIEDNRPGDRT